MPKQTYEVRGFDPRFGDVEWSRMLFSTNGLSESRQKNPVSKIGFHLSRTYGEFVRDFEERKFAGPNTLLIVDLAMVPQYLQTGLIRPLGNVPGFNFEKLMARRAESYGTYFNEGTIALARYMCAAISGDIGAVPLWINSQGRFICAPSQGHFQRPLTASASLDLIFERADAAVVSPLVV